jgi:hypothetical protein
MRLIIPAQLLLFASLFHLVAALGLNCRGSANCYNTRRVTHRLTQSIRGVNPNQWYTNGQQIACASVEDRRKTRWFCAYLQNSGGAWGSTLIQLALYLEAHGCKGCGSIPINYPDGNDVAHGELTYNFVRKSCSQDGLCPVTSDTVRFQFCTCI